MTIATPPSLLGHIRDGRVRALAIGAPKRSPLLPSLPTLAEARGGDDTLAFTFFGFAAAAGTPRPIIDPLNAEIHSILQLADVRARLAGIGAVPHPSSPEEMHEQIVREITRWARVVDLKKIERQ